MNWWQGLKVKIKFNYPLKDKTSFKVGGEARFFACPRSIGELKKLLSLAKKHKFSVLVLGAGSNLIISDQGVKALVIKLSGRFSKKIYLKDNCLTTGSGLKLARLIRYAQDKSLQGLEFLVGIPGTLGGAVLMNAGAWGKCLGELVKEVEGIDYNNKIKKIPRERIKFAYRESGLEKYIILSAVLKLNKRNKKEIRANLKRYLLRRKDVQDYSFPNAGCIFKNPAQASSGSLIELCGLKGKAIGGAVVSKKHANFILNEGRARSKDILRLMDLIKKQVRSRFNLILVPEIKIWR
ncbi:MAG: UDP-N-acetylmuramate dehydrogenase [Candidatus Omnitrophica bacterium]|nr:UDP-N-acetylmuramate dehydrogenase [Candidatus Omnitrophota bacterium]